MHPPVASRPVVSGSRQASPLRQRTNVTLPEDLLQEARHLKINLSQACERGLTAAVSAAKAQAWLEENQGAISAWNAHVDEHDVPLAEYRQF
ncbi:type II toxin-antitoxin system CcdA family antitoxin [Niveispirillum fermenti]|uniref:type II toxin-antitoxin system CcdA family antitoxin n=1 Tax=Niveispirillum fermenti TaxID=1233113 RepID=UPI003A8668C3